MLALSAQADDDAGAKQGTGDKTLTETEHEIKFSFSDSRVRGRRQMPAFHFFAGLLYFAGDQLFGWLHVDFPVSERSRECRPLQIVPGFSAGRGYGLGLGHFVVFVRTVEREVRDLVPRTLTPVAITTRAAFTAVWDGECLEVL